MRAQTFPGWPHPEGMPTDPALGPGQPAGDFTAVLEHIQMPPGHHFGVVMARRVTRIFGAPHQFPELGGLPNFQKNGPARRIKAALHYFPVQA